MWSVVVAFFNDLGWISNALAIGTPVLGCAALIHKNRKRLFKSSSFAVSANSDLALSKWTVEKAKAIVRIAIVDDEPQDFPTAELRKAGFAIKTYRQVRLADVEELGKFDVVFLDMHGIVKDDIEQGGLSLISNLRANNPTQKICAVSSKTFDPTATSFFRQADDVQKKPISSHKCKLVLETFINEKLNPNLLAPQIDQNFVDRPRKDRRKALDAVLAYKDSKQTFDELMTALRPLDLKGRDQLLIADFARIYRHVAE